MLSRLKPSYGLRLTKANIHMYVLSAENTTICLCVAYANSEGSNVAEYLVVVTGVHVCVCETISIMATLYKSVIPHLSNKHLYLFRFISCPPMGCL